MQFAGIHPHTEERLHNPHGGWLETRFKKNIGQTVVVKLSQASVLASNLYALKQPLLPHSPPYFPHTCSRWTHWSTLIPSHLRSHSNVLHPTAIPLNIACFTQSPNSLHFLSSMPLRGSNFFIAFQGFSSLTLLCAFHINYNGLNHLSLIVLFRSKFSVLLSVFTDYTRISQTVIVPLILTGSLCLL